MPVKTNETLLGFFLTRIARYLLEHLRAITKFRKGETLDVIKVHTDSDWAGCGKTRIFSSPPRVALSFREESSKVGVQRNLRWLCPAEKRSTARR